MSAPTALAQKGAAGLFGGLAGLGGRPLHPVGIAFSATLTVPGATWPGAALFERSGTYEARVRFSRGFGLPEPLPEVLSLAVKVLDAYGAGADQDFLLTASYEPPGLRHAFAFGRSHLGEVALDQRLTDEQERALTFNSDTTGGGIAASGWINRVRGAAYDASTRMRPTP